MVLTLSNYITSIYDNDDQIGSMINSQENQKSTAWVDPPDKMILALKLCCTQSANKLFIFRNDHDEGAKAIFLSSPAILSSASLLLSL